MTELALRVGTLFDGTAVSGPATVFVADGVITAVDAVVPDGVHVQDLGPDSFLLPGLIDTHIHLVFDASPNSVAALIEADDATLLERMRAAARSLLQAGITTVRDLGDRDYLSLKLAAELVDTGDGPQIISAGPPITTPGGHCHYLGGELDRPHDPDVLRAAVRERHERGCGVVKIMASGGNITPGSHPYESQFSLADLQVVVTEAHRLGLPVAAHAHGTQAIHDAVVAGVDSIEHVTFWAEDGPGEPDPAVLAAIADSDVTVSLTLGLTPGAELPVRSKAAFARLSDTIRLLGEIAPRTVVGSDAGIGPHKRHDVLPYGVVDMTRRGFTPLAAITSATSVAARVCGVADRKGRIGVGADADLLVLGGNPIEDPEHLHDVRAVFRAGVQVR